ncbi:hypothetical protein [Streptomyces sp. NPDC005336]|uniref:hypothetical protein n=1 Tax=Streptomyces sp. NPDC005336 TaxID=3157035 RepID=UPI00339F1376
MITALDHAQLAAPPGTGPALRAYYGEVLGMTTPRTRPATGWNSWNRSGELTRPDDRPGFPVRRVERPLGVTVSLVPQWRRRPP